MTWRRICKVPHKLCSTLGLPQIVTISPDTCIADKCSHDSVIDQSTADLLGLSEKYVGVKVCDLDYYAIDKLLDQLEVVESNDFGEPIVYGNFDTTVLVSLEDGGYEYHYDVPIAICSTRAEARAYVHALKSELAHHKTFEGWIADIHSRIPQGFHAQFEYVPSIKFTQIPFASHKEQSCF